MQGIFVTGTDTGVGKTAVAGALAAALRAEGIDAGVMKPVQTGAIRASGRLLAPDAEYLRAVAGIDDPPEIVCPMLLEAPLAPMVAAEIAGQPVDLQAVMDAYRRLRRHRQFLVVEGAGGLAVPIMPDYDMADLAREMGLPLVVVARPSLGTINHTLLTVYYARAVGLDIAGVVINRWPAAPDAAEQSNPAVIERLCGVPVLGLLAEDAEIDTGRCVPGGSVANMRDSGILQRLMQQTI